MLRLNKYNTSIGDNAKLKMYVKSIVYQVGFKFSRCERTYYYYYFVFIWDFYYKSKTNKLSRHNEFIKK